MRVQVTVEAQLVTVLASAALGTEGSAVVRVASRPFTRATVVIVAVALLLLIFFINLFLFQGRDSLE